MNDPRYRKRPRVAMRLASRAVADGEGVFNLGRHDLPRLCELHVDCVNHPSYATQHGYATCRGPHGLPRPRQCVQP